MSGVREPDILDAALNQLIDDDYNHIPGDVLRERLEDIRDTSTETVLQERADDLIGLLRHFLTEKGDPEYGPVGRPFLPPLPDDFDPYEAQKKGY